MKTDTRSADRQRMRPKRRFFDLKQIYSESLSIALQLRKIRIRGDLEQGHDSARRKARACDGPADPAGAGQGSGHRSRPAQRNIE
jgi:hypothetical protein